MTKQEIEKEAREYASKILGIPPNDIYSDDTIIAGYIAGRTKAEEKKEREILELQVEVRELTDIRDRLHRDLKSVRNSTVDAYVKSVIATVEIKCKYENDIMTFYYLKETMNRLAIEYLNALKSTTETK